MHMMVMITGASGGLGRALAVECAQRGYDLFLTDLHETELEKIRSGILRQYDNTVTFKACDLTDEGAVAEMFAFIDSANLNLDMLLNVAGIDFEGGFMKRECNEIIDIVRVNVEATLRITHEAIVRRNHGKRFYIVFVSSLASQYPIPLKATYSASKRFLLDFSIALGQELKRENTYVLSLCPGGLPTTENAMMGIAAQGFWGAATANRLETVAHRTISKVLAGKHTYFPGWINCILCIVGKLLPNTLIARLLYNRWRTAQTGRFGTSM